MKTLRMMFLLLAAVALLLPATGCQIIAEKAAEKVAEEAIEGSTGNQVDIEGDKVNIQGEDGSTASVGEGAEVPADFPKDVPVYEGTVLGAFSNDDSWTLQIETADDPQKVIAFYVKELDKEDWVKESQADMGDGGMYSAKKGETRTVTIVAGQSSGEDDEKTSVSISVTQE